MAPRRCWLFPGTPPMLVKEPYEPIIHLKFPHATVHVHTGTPLSPWQPNIRSTLFAAMADAGPCPQIVMEHLHRHGQ